MYITKQEAQDIVDYNTTGKGKGNPRYTDLVNARKWLLAMEYLKVEQLCSKALRFIK